MILDCILTACNTNELYINFIPYFIKAWNKLFPQVDVKIILINDTIPEKFNDYKNNIILFPLIPNISSAFISQYIRILYPAIMDYENGIMITDMDMIPMNRTYFTENIKLYDNNKFISLRDCLPECYRIREIPICYNVATSKTWAEIFNIHSLDDIHKRLYDVYNNINYHTENGWITDQKDLHKYIMNWNKKNNDFIYIKDNQTNFKRLDRAYFPIFDKQLECLIQFGYFSDYHCFRPYEKYKDINDKILEIL